MDFSNRLLCFRLIKFIDFCATEIDFFWAAFFMLCCSLEVLGVLAARCLRIHVDSRLSGFERLKFVNFSRVMSFVVILIVVALM